jgi:drug/metabolite transporter (DMT)-like permease
VLATLAAFVGLAIMLGVSVGNADGRGMSLSLMGSVATAVNAILVARHFRQVDVLALTLHFSAAAMVFLALLAALFGEVRLPGTTGGWGGMVGVATLQAMGTPLYFYAITKIGALKTGMVTNIQPVTSIFEAWVLFDEVLGVLQALGGALVLFAIGIMQWADLRKRLPKD